MKYFRIILFAFLPIFLFSNDFIYKDFRNKLLENYNIEKEEIKVYRKIKKTGKQLSLTDEVLHFCDENSKYTKVQFSSYYDNKKYNSYIKYYYDENYKNIYNIQYNDDDEIMTKNEFNYDNIGNLILLNVYDNKQKVFEVKYEYNENNKIKKQYIKNLNDNKITTIEYFYSENKLIEEIEYFDSNKRISNYKYKDNNRVIEIAKTDINNNNQNEKIIIYIQNKNELKRIIERKEYDSNDNLLLKEVYIFYLKKK